MLRGYKCVNKDAKTILTILGFDSKSVNRGWIIIRKNNLAVDKPCRMHAIVNQDNDKTEYIDIHSDFQLNGTHTMKRGRRTKRWNEIFKQIDFNEPCNAGHKLLNHYAGLRQALKLYHEKLKHPEGS